MSIFDPLWNYLADKIRPMVLADPVGAAYSDSDMKGEAFSVESEISEALADLMILSFTMPIEGGTRAQWLDGVADDFVRRKLKTLIVEAFISGDAIVVPSWNGRNFDNVVVGADRFEIFKALGDEIISMAYIVDSKTFRNGEKYTLIQLIELEPYSVNGETHFMNSYTLYIMHNEKVVPFDQTIVSDWSDYTPSWFIPNVDRLLIGRMRSNTFDPTQPNRVKGAPICYGASQPIREIHYLLDQMHTEFGLSEKAIMADKRLFKKQWNSNGDSQPVLPRGSERLFRTVEGQGSDFTFEEWAPEIRYQAYLDALDVQEKLVEKAVGVSHGIISDANDYNYENVDNVRKSQQKTMAFVSSARANCESMLENLAYSWDVIANYYNLAPVGEYSVIYNWSNEYIETFADKQKAILAGESIGATDAVDYRMFLYNESPEVAREKVAEIQANRQEFSVISEV